jgi:hypothetical protein
MAKQMKRVEKRYVPQQESFRQLPGLRPQAEPGQAVATPAPDPEALRLRELAESLAAGNKALGDFFTMEKSFEETNRVAQRIRGRLGLEQTEGPGGGFLDWGSDYGYQEGRGLAQGITLKDNLRKELADNNYFIDEANPNPQKTMDAMNSHVQQFITMNLGDDSSNPAFMQGVSQYLVEAKVEATVEAGIRLEAIKTRQQMANFSTWAQKNFIPKLAEFGDNPQGLRNLMSETIKESSRFGMNKDAAADTLLVSTLEHLEGMYTEAFNMEAPTESIQAMETATALMSDFIQAASLNDASGVPLGGFGMSADGKRMAPLKETLTQLKQRHREMVSELDKKGKAVKATKAIKAQNEVLIDMVDNRMTKVDILNKYRKLQESDPELLQVVLNMAVDTENKWNTDDNPDLVKALIKKGASMSEVESQLTAGLLSKDDYTQLATVWSNRRSQIQYAQSQADRRESKYANSQAKEEKAIVEANIVAVRKFVSDNNMIQDSGFRSYMEDIAKQGTPLTKQDMDAELKSYRTRQEMDKVPAQTAKDNIAKVNAVALVSGEQVDPRIVKMVEAASGPVSLESITDLQFQAKEAETKEDATKRRTEEATARVDSILINVPDVQGVLRGPYRKALIDHMVSGGEDFTSVISKATRDYLSAEGEYKRNPQNALKVGTREYIEDLKTLYNEYLMRLPMMPDYIIENALKE